MQRLPVHIPFLVESMRPPFHITPLSHSSQQPEHPLITFARLAHIAINRQAEGRKARAPKRCGLRPRRRRQRSSCDAPCHDAIHQIVLRPVPLDAAFGARKDGADLAKVARRRVRARAHVAQTSAELFAQGERLDSGGVGVRRERCVVLHL